MTPAPWGAAGAAGSGVAFRKILSHFPEELSLAFAYGSGGVPPGGAQLRLEGEPGGPFAFGPSRALELPGALYIPIPTR